MTEHTDAASSAGTESPDSSDATAPPAAGGDGRGGRPSPGGASALDFEISVRETETDSLPPEAGESSADAEAGAGASGPALAAEGASPEPAAEGASPEPAAESASPEPAAEGASPEPAAEGASPAPTADAATKEGELAATEAEAKALDIRAQVYGRTDVGQVREHNEDNLLMADLSRRQRGVPDTMFELRLGPEGGLLAVCDGMGGAAAGEIASQLAVDIVYEKMLEARGPRDRDHLAMAIVEALEVAGLRILAESNKNRACRGMGTTATVAAWVDDHLLLGQVGDSRGYLLRGERLVQVTRDQSLVNQLIEAGQLTEEEAENFEHSNIILQALGTADAVQVDLTYVELRRGDALLLCSDGLSGLVRDDEIREVLCEQRDPAGACRQLIEIANEAGGHDNITAVVALFDGDDLRVASADEAAALRYRKYPIPAWMDHSHVDTGGMFGGRGGEPYDDTPDIEVHGEIELGSDVDWDDLLEDAPQIPTASGGSWSTFAIVAVIVGLLVAGYLLMR